MLHLFIFLAVALTFINYIICLQLHNCNKYNNNLHKNHYVHNHFSINMMNEINLPNKKLPVTVLSGFLGSGKTTLLKHILTSDHHGKKYAVIVNDMNELNIDSLLIQPYIKQQEEKLIEFSNGCICCTLRDDLLKEVAHLASQNRYEHLIIESTGISEPLPVAETFTFELTNEEGITQSLSQIAEIDTMVTVVDAVNFLKDIDVAEDLAQRGLQADANDTRSITDLLVSQIEFANVIIINKCDLVSTMKLMKVKQTIRALNADAKIIESIHSNINIDEIIGSKSYDYDKVSQSATWLHAINQPHETEKIPETEEYGISSFVYRARKPFHPMRLMNFIENELVGDDGEDDIIPPVTTTGTSATAWSPAALISTPIVSIDSCSGSTSTGKASSLSTSDSAGTRIIRSKGFFWLASRPMDTMIWSQAGGLFHLTSGGPWWADTPTEQWPCADAIIPATATTTASSPSIPSEVVSLLPPRSKEETTSTVITYASADEDDEEAAADLLKQIQSDWLEPYGDRRQELVFIGVDLDKSIVQSKLDQCLLSEEEITKGKEYWITLQDPFPIVEEEFLSTTTSVIETTKEGTIVLTPSQTKQSLIPSTTTVSSTDTVIAVKSELQVFSSPMKSFEQLMDEMQLVVEKEFNSEESVKKLEEIITTFAKIPQVKIREIVSRYEELGVSALTDIPKLTSAADLETHLRAGLSVLWSASNNNWDSFNKLFQLEVSKESAINSNWMKAAIVFANNGSEKKLKDLIKKYGTINEIPKGRRYSVDIENARGGQGKGRKKSILKVDYVASLIELLRENNENDYHKVFLILEKENLSSKKEAGETKGFSTAKNTANK